jgi:leucyl/phenylalanyl-tRNA---protein transferase
LGAWYGLALQPKRVGLMPRLTWLTAAHVLKPTSSTQELVQEPTFYREEGLVGICNDLSVDALLSAYKRGIFPVCHIGPMKCWSPTERAVLFFTKAHIEKTVRKQIRQDRFDVTFDQDFAAVMRACAEPRPGKTPLTWLTPRMMNAFWDLHKAGYAHSVEVWDLEPQLVGGMFGIAIGGVFFGESQFSRARGASKIASAFLNCHLAHWGFALRDAKWMSDHLAGLGFTIIDRDMFEGLLKQHVSSPSRRNVGSRRIP